MSRTWKDRSWQRRWPEAAIDSVIRVAYEAHPHTTVWNEEYRCLAPGELDYTKTVIRYMWVKQPGEKTKKKRNFEDFHWQRGTPSAWTNMMMNRPQRTKGKQWCIKVLQVIDLEECDPPNVSRKPHCYYW